MTRIASIDGIQRRYLHDEVAERIRALILSGELEPKSRVNELELSERFGISRTPLREAIKILATEGLLELLPNRGARVASVNEGEIDEMLEVVAGLEANAGMLAAERASAHEIEHIEKLHKAMVDCWGRSDEEGYFTLNRDIHEAIMKAARNATLAGIYASLSGRIQRFRYTAHKTPAQWSRAVAEHEDMVRLLKVRDGEALARLMRLHVLGKKEPIAATYGG
jgi:DNA-binding GntR family transcriptional regulator